MTIKSNTPPEEKDEAQTPPYLFNYAKARWTPDIDLAASHENHKCSKYFTYEDNSLIQDWARSGSSGWCNPPYSNIPPWLLKAAEHRDKFRTILLIPTPNGEAMYKIVEEYASELILIHGRISFVRPNGQKMTGNTRGSCFVVFDWERGSNQTCKLSWLDRNILEENY